MKILIPGTERSLPAATRAELARDRDMELLSWPEAPEQPAAVLERLHPDVVLLSPDDADAIPELRASAPSVKVVVLAPEMEPGAAEAAFRRGASAYVLASLEPRDLASAIRQTVQATAYHAPASGSRLARDEARGRPSRR